MPDLYRENNELTTHTLAQRTREEGRRFTFALWEMSRLYAYQGCEVLVVPQYTEPSAFPNLSGVPRFHNGDVATFTNEKDIKVETQSGATIYMRDVAKNGVAGTEVYLELGSEPSLGETIEVTVGDATASFQNVCTWGRVSRDKYRDRGWCVSERSK